MKFYIYIFLLSVFISSLNGEVKTYTKSKTVEGVGVGLSREEAVDNAIIEALGQLQGVKIKKESFSSTTVIESDRGDSATYRYDSKINKLTNGKVDSYSILNVDEIGNGKYEATVSITKTKVTKKYVTPGHNPKNRRAIAIIPLYSDKPSFNIAGYLKGSKAISQKFTQELVTSITKTRKFTVLDREMDEVYQREKSLLLSGDANREELLKLGNVLGTDYLFIGNIVNFKIDKREKYISITGQRKVNYFLEAIVQYRILAMSSRQIKFSDTFSLEEEIFIEDNSIENILQKSIERISKEITEKIIDNIYPIKIAEVSKNGDVILNMGSENLKEGELFDIFKMGKRVIDPYTKEYIGRDEIYKGTIEVVRVLPKISYARVIEGVADKNYICRKVKMKKVDKDEASGESEVTIQDSGGVVLPFD